MATTRIMPLHIGKGRTESRAISAIIDYVANPQKTDHGRLITSYQCDSRVADAQFLLDKQTYAARTGRVRGKDDVIAYHLRQSFVPGEITPEEANRLGVELARRLLGKEPIDFPRETAIGALGLYVSNESVADFQPMNVNFGIIPPLDHRVKGKRNKNAELSQRSLAILDTIKEEVLSL